MLRVNDFPKDPISSSPHPELPTTPQGLNHISSFPYIIESVGRDSEDLLVQLSGYEAVPYGEYAAVPYRD